MEFEDAVAVLAWGAAKKRALYAREKKEEADGDASTTNLVQATKGK